VEVPTTLNENNLVNFAKRPGQRAHKKKFFCHKSVRGYVKLILSGRQTDHCYDVSLTKTFDWVSSVAKLDEHTDMVQHDEDGDIDGNVQDDPIASFLPVKALFRESQTKTKQRHFNNIWLRNQ